MKLQEKESTMPISAIAVQVSPVAWLEYLAALALAS